MGGFPVRFSPFLKYKFIRIDQGKDENFRGEFGRNCMLRAVRCIIPSFRRTNIHYTHLISDAQPRTHVLFSNFYLSLGNSCKFLQFYNHTLNSITCTNRRNFATNKDEEEDEDFADEEDDDLLNEEEIEDEEIVDVYEEAEEYEPVVEPVSRMPVNIKFDDRRVKSAGDPKINEEIRYPQVRIINSDGTALGVMSSREALKKAKEKKVFLGNYLFPFLLY